MNLNIRDRGDSIVSGSVMSFNHFNNAGYNPSQTPLAGRFGAPIRRDFKEMFDPTMMEVSEE
jgi:hypothetical protein